MVVQAQPQTPSLVGHWRPRAALGLWLAGFLPPSLIPLVWASSWEPTTKSLVAALLVIGIPQVLTALAVALVGQGGLRQLATVVKGAVRHSVRYLATQPLHVLSNGGRGERS